MTNAQPPAVDLRTLQAFYTIGLGAGFVSLADALYSLFGLSRTESSSQLSATSPQIAASWAIVIALFFIGFRFFWAVTNVRRYAEDRIARGAKLGEISRAIVFVHIPVLFLHLLMYYLLCKLAAELSASRASTTAPRILAWTYAAYQYLNAAWLTLLTRARDRVFRERIWIRNNLASSTLAIAILVVGPLFAWSPDINLLVVSLVYIASSLIDLTLTAYHYLQSPDDPRMEIG